MRTTGLVYHRRAIELSHFWGFLFRSHIFAWTTWPETLWPRGIMRPRNWQIGHDALCFPCDVKNRKILIKRAWWHTTVSLACYFTHCLLISVSVYSPFYPKSCGGSQLLLHYSKVKKSRIKKALRSFASGKFRKILRKTWEWEETNNRVRKGMWISEPCCHSQ